eukprot:4291050-Lingulodinium_polyedra.AAC.1
MVRSTLPGPCACARCASALCSCAVAWAGFSTALWPCIACPVLSHPPAPLKRPGQAVAPPPGRGAGQRPP